MKGAKNKPHVMTISYHSNNNLMHQWGLLVYILQNFANAMAIPRYETKAVCPGVFQNEVETNASIGDMNRAIEVLMGLKRAGVFPELVNVFIMKES